MFRRFLKETGGNIAMMFGVLTVPLIAATGAAIDYSRAYEQRMIVQDALDAASLAANRLIGFATEDEIYAEAMAFFTANIDGKLDNTINLSMVVDEGTVELTTQLPVPTVFLGVVGVDSIDFNLRSLSMSGAVIYEIVLVLDNSGSMSGTKIDDLKDAAAALINSVFQLAQSNPAPNPVMVGLVPFTASVNVGPWNANQAWLDTTGIGPNAGINHDEGHTDFTDRFDLYNMMNGIGWAGCVEARAYPYDVNDVTPTPAVAATLFQPMFAPDAPDNGGYPNNYLADDGGTCEAAAPTAGVPACPEGMSRRWCRRNGYNPPGEPATPPSPAGPDYCDPDQPNYDLCLQERVCKYEGVNATAFNEPGEGPNLHCVVDPILPLTNDQAALVAAVNAMTAGGYTNIEQGAVWGWHVLSDTAPFTEGRAYGEDNVHKVMILMTDGANTYITRNNMNRSDYMAFNFIRHGYLGTTSSNNNVVVDAMNDRTIEVCANINAEPITVYTVAFELDDADAQQIMHDCASDPTKAYDAANGAELIAVFQAIAEDIATLRIAE
jgi:Mg-chelatase subunit ChlD